MRCGPAERWFRVVAILASIPAVPLAAQTTLVSIESRAGDPVGLGARLLLTPAAGVIGVTRAYDGYRVQFEGSGERWSLGLAGPVGWSLPPGMYEGAARWPLQSPTRPGLDVAAGGRACAALTGRFVVLEAVHDGSGEALRLAVDFEQRCRVSTVAPDGSVQVTSAPALLGAVRFNSMVPVRPRLSVGRVTASEGDFGTTAMHFVVSLSAPAPTPVSVTYITADGTALGGSDYDALSGTVSFAPGETELVVTVPVRGDRQPEEDEAFFFRLRDAVGAPIAFGEAEGLIRDDDFGHTVLAFAVPADAFVAAGQALVFTPADGEVTATRTFDNGVSVLLDGGDLRHLDFAAGDGSPLVPGTYEGAQRWPWQPPGSPGLDVGGTTLECVADLAGRFVVLEAVYDGTGQVQRFAADFERLCQGSPPALQGWVRFNSTVAVPPAVWVEPAVVSEGHPPGLAFPVRLSAASPSPVHVRYATSDRTAQAGSDYVPVSGTLVIPAGAVEGVVAVPMSDDPMPEGSEELELRLSDPAGAFLRVDRASGTILDDDRVAVLSVAPADAAEGDPGRPGRARFTLRLDVPTGTPVGVTYQIADGTALAGHDYVSVGGTLTFAPGATEQTIDVPMLADLEPEGDEYFSLSVSSASATVATPSVTGTIGDDDGPTGFYTISPCRLLDTRLHGWPVPGGAFRAFPAGNVCGIPVDAEAVVVNVTVVGPTHLGHVNVSPFGAAPTPTSAVNFGPGAVKGAGPLVVTLGEDGRLAVHCVMPPGSDGATHVVVDVAGYFK